MKITAISAAVALLASVVSAAPAGPAASYTPNGPNAIPITFIGAAEGRFTQYINSNYYGSSIYNPLSVSKISNPGSVTCFFYGTQGSFTTVPAGATVDVGPPQTQYYGYCA
ncbi:hypothetical protein XANCAGTX0491_000749 [Xanthoria calcicola]